MNYFELYNLPIGFSLDETQLKSSYVKLSKEYHPDFYTLSPAHEQDRVLELSSQNNKAYKILRKQESRIRYVLELLGVIGHETEEKVPQEFLTEMMELNELLMELEFDSENDELRQQAANSIEEMTRSIRSEVADSLALLNIESLSQEQAQSVKLYYFKSKYINRLRSKLSA